MTARITLNRPDTRSRVSKPDDRRLPKYGPWIKSLGMCAGCGWIGPVDPHHESAVEDKSDLAYGKKVDDRLQVPLCARLNGCHDVRHSAGQTTFWGDTDIPLRLTRQLQRAWGCGRPDDEAARRAVFRAHQDRQRKAGK